MLTQRAPVLARFTRSDATRAGIAATALILLLTAILSIDLLPSDPVRYEIGEVVREDLTAPRAVSFESQTLTDEARQQARAAVPFQFDYTAENAIAIAPTGMIFIPCRDGVSHRPDEYASSQAIARGIAVLADTLSALTSGASS